MFHRYNSAVKFPRLRGTRGVPSTRSSVLGAIGFSPVIDRFENMPSSTSSKTKNAIRRMDAGVTEAMRSRQEKNHLSELGVNWVGKGHLNASESDIMYKYHIVSANALASLGIQAFSLLHVSGFPSSL